MLMGKKRLLVLEPYYGGSHRQFLTGLLTHLAADYSLLTLPARKWKMRMQLSAPWFVEQIRQWPEAKRGFDAVLCSTFVDVALLRALLAQVDGWRSGTRFVTYFHENQFAYPGQCQDLDRYQFTALNFSTALASDCCAFNSAYNRQTFLSGVAGYLEKTSDMRLEQTCGELKRKCQVLSPGIDGRGIDMARRQEKSGPPIIVWNHRWEHDKDPDTFFAALYQLEEEQVPFRLIVLGQSFQAKPPCFAEARVRLRERILHFGYAKSRRDYRAILRTGDVVVSTARHEFFGLAVLEAVRAGCRPLLPHRLSYPELFPVDYLYGDGQLLPSLRDLLDDFAPMTEKEGHALTDPYDWPHLVCRYEQLLFA